MKYAILSDVHGNWEALTAVIKDAHQHGVDEFLNLGDSVGYNADPALCLGKIREIAMINIKGNHDYYCSNEVILNKYSPQLTSIIEWTKEQLSDEQIDYLSKLPFTTHLSDFILVHSNICKPEIWEYILTIENAELHFTHQDRAVCFYGHTHFPICFVEEKEQITSSLYDKIEIKEDKRYLINVGSVGQPRDNDPRSSYVIYDEESKIVQLRRLNYELREAQKKLIYAGLPDKLVMRLGLGQ